MIQNLIQEGLPFHISIHLTDIIDIAILSFVIYKVLWMMRKTSSGRVLKGIMLLLVAMWLSSRFQLIATSFLLNKAVEWGSVFIVVLFQPELRRFLERMGSSKLPGMFSSQASAAKFDMGSAISETVEAYTSMSKDKVVLERPYLLV